MRDPIASALRTAKGYGRRYAEGGDVDPEALAFEPPKPEPEGESWTPPPEPLEAGYPEPPASNKIRENVANFVKQSRGAPPPIPAPAQGQSLTEYHPTAAEKMGAFFAGEHGEHSHLADIAIGNRGLGSPGGVLGYSPILGQMLQAQEGVQHGDITEAGLAIAPAAKGPKPPPSAMGRVLFDLSPNQVKGATPLGGSLGTSKGSVFTGFVDGIDRYVKEAKSLNHAKQEVLTSKLYEAVGVPVAKNELTQLNGKPAVSSHLVSGDQLSHIDPSQYEHIGGLEEHMPADAWLANGDVIGAGVENPKGNILVSHGEGGKPEATRIDFGGALGYSGLGTPKPEHLFGNSVAPYLKGLRDESINPTAAEAFHSHVIGPENETAQRIAALPDHVIRDNVDRYGPTDAKAKKQLADKIIARRDDIAKQYGIESKPQLSVIEGGKGKEPYAPPENVYSFKDPHKDTTDLLMNHLQSAHLDASGEPIKEGGFDIKGIANDMYKMAEKNPEYVDQIYKKLPDNIYNDVFKALDTKIKKEGDPWASVGIPAGQLAKGNAPGGNLTLMQLNKAHNVDQVVNAIKPYQKGEVNVGKTVTEKQKDNITKMISATPSMQVATAIKDLAPDEIKNVLSWMPPAKAANVKHLAKVDPEKAAQPIPDIGDIKKNHSLYQIINAIKNYSPLHAEVPYHAYQGVPKEISKFSPHEIMKEMENLSLNQKQKVMMWLPESTKEKMANIGYENAAKKKGFIEQEYYDALKPVDWQNYKPKGSTSVREQVGSKTLKEMISQGYNPDLALFKGGKHHGTYPYELVDPVTEAHKLANPDERALFLSDKVVHTEPYGLLGGEYVARPEKVYSVDWQDLTGTEDYAAHHMTRIIEAAREQGADLVIVRGVHDTSGYGHASQDQYAFLNTHVLRGPKATFDPDKLHLRHPLAGLVGGGLFSYGMLRGQEDKEQRYARGGSVKVPKASVNYSKGMEKSHCGICQFYQDKTCSKVQGPIDWSFWCRLYKAKGK